MEYARGKIKVDGVINGCINSNMNYSQLNDALLEVGGALKILKGGVSEASIALGILADNGIKASAGASLRNIIFSLAYPTNKSDDLINKLGLEVFDSSGKMRSIQDIFNDLNRILGDMTDKERTEALCTMFNRVDLKSVSSFIIYSADK